jgi:hypothetical protein
MKQIPDMEQKLETVLNSLDGIQRAKPTPYFYTRLRAKMARGERGWSVAGLISRPAYALAMVCTVILINVWIVMSDKEEDPVAAFPKTAVQQLPDEYNVAVATFYEYETP